jgi:hypothetical protein
MDLVQNQKHEEQTPSGDLAVRILRGPTATGSNRFEWSLELTATDGGLIESNDEFNYIAPESGYESSIIISANPRDPNWADNLTKNLFIRCRGGRVYAFLHLWVRPDYNGGQAAISFETRLSQDGSRNLEP